MNDLDGEEIISYEIWQAAYDEAISIILDAIRKEVDDRMIALFDPDKTDK